MTRLRSSLGWRAKGNVSISRSSGMWARLRRRRRACSVFVRYSASSTCFSNRSCEKRPRRAAASNSSHCASSPPRRRCLRIFRNSSSKFVFTFWFVGLVFLVRCLVIARQVGLVGPLALLVSRSLAITLVHLHVGQVFALAQV